MLLAPFSSDQRAELRQMIEVNLLGAITATEVFLDQLRDGSGDLVNISSVAGRTARPGNAGYAATKWGLNGWSESLRQELQPDVRVLVIEPGAVATELTDHITHAETKAGAEQMYEQTSISAQDVAEVIAFAIARPRNVSLILEAFGNVIAPGGSGVVISSQSGHRLAALSAEQNQALATTPVEELLGLPFLQSDQVEDSLHAYQLAKRGNSLRVMAEAVRWGNRGARINTISPGIIITPLAKDELTGPRGEGYRRMIETSAVGRAGTPDEVGAVGALLMGPDGGFITGSDFLMDGGVTAAYWYGEIPEVRN